jgi:uncharacterized membrane protein YfcA
VTAAAGLLVLLAGLAVGATSIGGILVVPVLSALTEVPLRDAIAASNFSFAFSGLTAFLVLRFASARGAVATAQPPPASLFWAALAGAAIGAFTLQWLPPMAARLMVAALALLSGTLTLRGAVRGGGQSIGHIPAPLAIGFAVGCGSAWSGTGGPALLLPVLLLARVSPPLVVAAGQGLQLPIAGATTVINLASGQLNLLLGAGLGVLMAAGWMAGWRLARNMPVATLRRVLACGLIIVGLWYGWQTLKEAFT